MPVFTSIRKSPAYLYVKSYCLCALVTLLRAAPVSSRLPKIGERLQLANFKIINTRLGPRIVPVERNERPGQSAANEDGKPAPIALDLVISKELFGAWANQSRLRNVPARWIRRAMDLAQIKTLLRHDDQDSRMYPETRWDALVRRSSSLHPEEKRFIAVRKQRISYKGSNSLHVFLELPPTEKVDPRDVPLIALGGSGGGYRAMYGFAAFISAANKLGLWDCITWVSGVSGSCWTLAAYYTIARQNIASLQCHYLAMAQELAHPMSVQALNTVARSKRGTYFLIGPLVRKARTGIIGLGIMDMYATLTTAYQFLSREPRANLSRATFQFSKVWQRSGLDSGLQPMPILTAVRRAPRDTSGVRPHADSSNSKGLPPRRALKQHETNMPQIIAQHHEAIKEKLPESNPRELARQDPLENPVPKGFFQWFEASPLEVGSPDVQSYVPTWSWGRTFVSGRSVGRPPEQSLSLLLGQCTNAPAGPLSGYISALLASIPRGTAMSRLLLLLNDFVRMKRWEKLWASPIRAGYDPNPFYGHNSVRGRTESLTQPSDDTKLESSGLNVTFPANTALPETPVAQDIVGRNANGLGQSGPSLPDEDQSHDVSWETQGRIRLMDSGMSNNLPNHILARPERAADVIIAFDASSDVQTGSAIRRIRNFADDVRLELQDETVMFGPPSPNPSFKQGIDSVKSASLQVESKLLDQYTRVFRCVRETGQELYIIYCPLLPNGVNPENDKASFSNSYNLVWTPGQIKTLFTTSSANVSNYAIEIIKKVTMKVYETNKARRLAAETSEHPNGLGNAQGALSS
ncbi:putative Lysophospholipase [Seiridium unicorne]|uniref:Lysophospholipase n=1 Tax=Seiridium unicorne TaxID=138068 RepID=A0ABR2V062_9PEZI